MNHLARRNAATFGPGTFGRDMAYTLVSLYLVYYVTEVVRPGDLALWWITATMLVARLFDAVMDFVMGSVVERTRTRWGQYKPWIAAGGVASAVLTVLLFNDIPHLDGAAFVAVFTLCYLAWGLAWSSNDIPFWSLLPALTVNPRERTVIGAVAKVCGTLGLFAVAVGTLPAAAWLSARTGSPRAAWFWIAVGVGVAMLAFQFITLIGVREPRGIAHESAPALRDVWSILRRNDQVLWVAACMTLFMTGFQATTTFGPYYFKYVWRDESAYPAFAAIVGIAQVLGYASFPALARRVPRFRAFGIACALIFVGYVGFFLAPHSFAFLAAVGFAIFLGQAYIVMLTMLMLSDTVEYGQWKTGERHGAVTFALQPFLYKASAALATAMVAATTVVTGIADAHVPGDVSLAGLAGFRVVMLLVPLAMMALAAVLLRRHFILDEATYGGIVDELRERGKLTPH